MEQRIDCVIRRRRSGGYSSFFFCLAVFLPFWLATNAAFVRNTGSAPFEEAFSKGLYGREGRSDADRAYWQGLIAAMNPALTERDAGEIVGALLRYSSRYGLEPGLVAAIIKVESSGNPFAVSSKGAQGLMQVMPFWKKELGVHGTLFDIDNNIDAGCRILAENIRRWGFDEGIARYYRGNLPVSGENYIVKVKAALGRYS
ncbi:MAG: lytic transglycosylase domain-containing protein [Deltaproteobacteria bacterium]|nr:lytic transglycosylase domain-containing protein [Deltaproteobacteria bacterium]MCL4874735.1 lytic transglycosylase domain-containing protein [bacterium]